MAMTPIHRIPKMDSEMTLGALVNLELGNSDAPFSIAGIMTDMIEHDNSNEGLGILLDWAMEIRDTLGIDWGNAIHAASILYYG